MRDPDHALSPATLAVTAGRPGAEPNAPLSVPIVHTSTYVASPGSPREGDLGYGRWTNPTWQAFETALGRLEGGEALLFASGMAAVAAVGGQCAPLGGGGAGGGRDRRPGQRLQRLARAVRRARRTRPPRRRCRRD